MFLGHGVAVSDTKAISVTRLVRRMRNLLEIELGEVWVEGEVSNLRKQASGHHYFTLKDEGGQIPAVLFRGNARHLKFELADGMQVMVFGDASLYEARGQVQLIVRKVEQQGQGDLQKKFEQLKAKLMAEGLFEKEGKKALPLFPERVGLITSGSAAALQDILNVMKRRAPWVQPILYPVQVQGNGAERGIAAAIRDWSTNSGLPKVDVIIVGRGGGSIEDLWNFNEEVVARAIADCPIPIVSAVGHEIDFTIADFVADMRAPTPSAAAELVVPDGEELLRRIASYQNVIDRSVERRLERDELVLKNLKQGVLSRSPDNMLRESMLKVDQLSAEMEHLFSAKIEQMENKLLVLKQRHSTLKPLDLVAQHEEHLLRLRDEMNRLLEHRLEMQELKLDRLRNMHRALGPESAFSRGFSLTTNAKGEIIKSQKQVSEGEQIQTRFSDGVVESVVSGR